MAAVAAAEVSARTGEVGAERERPARQTPAEVQALKARDNTTNWLYLARIYVVSAAAIGGAVWVDQAAMSGAVSWWWAIAATLTAIVVIGASQHQFGGVIHEGTHFMLFANRTLNELASDWLGAFPILTTTYHYRLHHLAHHQFVNDPERDPDISQLHESHHWLDFPITHVEMLWALLKQLWLPNLFRYTITRARYSSIGGGHNPYANPDQPGTIRPLRAGILFAVGAPAVVIPLTVMGNWLAVAIVLPVMWAVVVTILWMLPDTAYPGTRLAPVTPIRWLGISRVHLPGAALWCAVGRAARRLGPGVGLLRPAVAGAGIHSLPAVHDPAPVGAARQRRPRTLYQHARVPGGAAGALRGVPVRHGLPPAAPPDGVGAALQSERVCTKF